MLESTSHLLLLGLDKLHFTDSAFHRGDSTPDRLEGGDSKVCQSCSVLPLRIHVFSPRGGLSPLPLNSLPCPHLLQNQTSVCPTQLSRMMWHIKFFNLVHNNYKRKSCFCFFLMKPLMVTNFHPDVKDGFQQV